MAPKQARRGIPASLRVCFRESQTCYHRTDLFWVWSRAAWGKRKIRSAWTLGQVVGMDCVAFTQIETANNLISQTSPRLQLFCLGLVAFLIMSSHLPPLVEVAVVCQAVTFFGGTFRGRSLPPAIRPQGAMEPGAGDNLVFPSSRFLSLLV